MVFRWWDERAMSRELGKLSRQRVGLAAPVANAERRRRETYLVVRLSNFILRQDRLQSLHRQTALLDADAQVASDDHAFVGRVEKPEFDLGSDFLLARHLRTRRAQTSGDRGKGRDWAVRNVYLRIRMIWDWGISRRGGPLDRARTLLLWCWAAALP